MFSFLLIIGLVSSSTSFSLKDVGNFFISGGQDTTISSRLYQVSIQSDEEFICSGALVKPDFVLTVASCVYGYDPQQVSVRAGSNNRDKGGVTEVAKNIIIHPNFTMYMNDYDLAIVQLNNAFLQKDIKTIKIAVDEVIPNHKVYTAGWGEDKMGVEGKLEKLQLIALDIEDCRKKYEFEVISSRMICAWKDKDDAPCWNDFGDPLHNEWNALVGFYSWAEECSKHPSVYTNIHPMIPWIKQTIPNL